jgi:hypothetical protein
MTAACKTKTPSLLNMTFTDYKIVVSELVKVAHKNDIRYQQGRRKGDLVEANMFKTVFGLKRSAHSQLLRGTYARKSESPVPPPVQQTIRFLKMLPEKQLVAELKVQRDQFEQDRYS